jgi:hypothetical protein
MQHSREGVPWQWQWQCNGNGNGNGRLVGAAAHRFHAQSLPSDCMRWQQRNRICSAGPQAFSEWRDGCTDGPAAGQAAGQGGRAGQQDRQGTSACCSCAVHTLLFAHRNSRLALGMNAAFDCLCAVSNIGVQLFRWPPFPTVAVPAAVGIVVAVVAVHVAVHVQRASVGSSSSSSSEDHGERASSSSWTSSPCYTDQVSPNSFWY